MANVLHIVVCAGIVPDPRDFVEAQWRICDPIVAAWDQKPGPLPTYEAGSQGPKEADGLLREGDSWRAI